jgi:hypothetical protein
LISVDSDGSERANVETTKTPEMISKNTEGGTDSHASAVQLNDVDLNVAENVPTDGHMLKIVEIAPSKPFVETVEGVSEKTGQVHASVGDDGKSRKRRNKNSASSTDDALSLGSGPWSVDWLKNIQKGDVGLISSKNKRLKKVGTKKGGRGEKRKDEANKKQVGGVLRHPVLTLKRWQGFQVKIERR